MIAYSVDIFIYMPCLSCINLVLGWQWDVEDRPTFSEIHKELNSMFHDSGGVTHGNR